MTEILGHDINGKPIYVGSPVVIVETNDAWRHVLGHRDVVIGPAPDDGPYPTVECLAHNVYTKWLEVQNLIGPLSEDTQEERELEHVL